LRTAAGWSAAPGWLQRLYAVRAVAGLAWPSKAELLQRLGRDPDPRVQGEALGALASADSALPLGPVFLEGLASPDPLVRANAAEGLGKRLDPAYFSALMQAYDRAQRDSINDAALAAVDALARLAGRGVPVATSFFLRFRPATNPIVRSRVAQRFGTGEGSWGEPRPIDTGRNIAFYRQVVQELMAPVLAGEAAPRVRVSTSRGDIVLALDPVAAPLTVHNFLELIRSGFYARPDLRWHRVVPNFVLQDGDPRGDGSGGPPHVIRDEINLLRYGRGVLGMALSGPDTGGSQFFITHSPQPHLDGGYTIFGKVVAGIEVADAILQDDRITTIEVVR
jgi:cyclophilin family peptidyl-prolyl cis-trans isomerase